ncbi:hypothetical protein GHK86_04815 [Acidimicrobiaceae bacterium USS-CC1]|uniref:Uncharacterized protein n=1 Tax=Acidiferrimicrobium australe TaxID=2664430 RepID=A0ABW9QQX4_9ACTN|nr:hypothetical protein [Acidiferrimicrobium australe]
MNAPKDQPVLVEADYVRTAGGFVRFINRSGELGVDEELVRMFKAGRVLEVELVEPDEDE